MDVPEAGEGGIEAGTLLPVGPVFLHGLTHLLICHLQEVLQTQLARGDLLEKGRDRRAISIALKAKQLTVSDLDSQVSPLLPSWERDRNWGETQSNLQVSTASNPDAK